MHLFDQKYSKNIIILSTLKTVQYNFFVENVLFEIFCKIKNVFTVNSGTFN